LSSKLHTNQIFYSFYIEWLLQAVVLTCVTLSLCLNGC